MKSDKLKLLSFIIIATFCQDLFCQSFEGKITFKNNFTSKSKQVNGSQLNVLMGTEQDYFIKANNYASLFNGRFIKKQIYSSAESRGYTITGQTDTAYWEDYKLNKDSMLTHQIILNKDTVLGIPCNLLIVKSKSSTSMYYYNSDTLIIDPNIFKNHNYGNWYNVVLITRCIPLKTIFENEQFQMVSEAVKIEKGMVDDKIFDLPDKNKVAPAKW